MAKREWTAEERAAMSEKMRALREAKKARVAEAAPVEEQEADEPTPIREPEVDEDAVAARRRRLLDGLPPEVAALISDADLAEIEAEETKKALADQKKKALADARGLARQYARIEHGLVPGDVLRSEDERKRLAEKVRIRVDLPEGGGALGFKIDGQLIHNGWEGEVTRAQYESLNYSFYRMHLNEVEISTLDQQKRGNSAREVLSRRRPQLEVRNAA